LATLYKIVITIHTGKLRFPEIPRKSLKIHILTAKLSPNCPQK